MLGVKRPHFVNASGTMGVLKVVGKTLLNFGRETSIGGLNNAARAKSLIRAIFWLCLFTGGIYFTIRGLIEVVKDYYSYPVVTKTELTQEKLVEFPAITVCNQNRVHCSHLLSEYYTQNAALETITDPKQKNTSEHIVNSLDTLFETTGCRAQICNVFKETIAPEREEDKNYGQHDLVLIKMRQLKCQNVPTQDNQLVCYHLAFAQDDLRNANKKYAGPSLAKIENAEEYYNCKSAQICSYKPKGPPVIGPSPSVNLPSSCVSGGNGNQGKNPITTSQSGNGTPGNGSDPGGNETISAGQSGNGTTGSGAASGQKPPQNRKKRSNRPDDKSGPPRDRVQKDYDALGGDIGLYAGFAIKYLDLDATTRQSIGHRLGTLSSSTGANISGFINDCTYRGTSCLETKYWLVQDTPGYGNCFTFNAASSSTDEESPRKASLTGMANGFSIELYLDQGNYMLQKLSKKAGARLVIHDPAVPPLPDEYGLDLQPNTASSIAIQRNDVQRKPIPYESNCSVSWASTGYNVRANLTYSLAACQRYCLQEDLIKSCGCFHPDLFQSSLPLHEQSRPCNIVPVSNNTDHTCFQSIFEEYNNLTRNCSCNVACKETEFSSTVTLSMWPSNQYYSYFAVDLNEGYSMEDFKDNGPRGDEAKENIQQNYVKADVYYQTLNVRSIVQEAKYSEEGFVSALGGALSVYLGIAVIMVFELLELGLDLFLNLWHHYNGKTFLEEKAGR